MSENYTIIIQFVLPLTTFYQSGAQRSNVYKRNASVTSWRFHIRAWQPQRHDRMPETSRTLWIHRGALTNQRCSLATGCGIKYRRCSKFYSRRRISGSLRLRINPVGLEWYGRHFVDGNFNRIFLMKIFMFYTAYEYIFWKPATETIIIITRVYPEDITAKEQLLHHSQSGFRHDSQHFGSVRQTVEIPVIWDAMSNVSGYHHAISRYS